MWEIFNVVPGINDDEEVIKNYSSNISENNSLGRNSNYISIGLYGNEFTMRYCAETISSDNCNQLVPLFKLSPHVRGECSIIVNDKPYKQCTYYPPENKSGPVNARGIDYGIIAKHYFKPSGLTRTKCAWWFFGGLAGPGTETVGVYFRSNYDELIAMLKDVCRGKSIDSRDVNFVLIIAVDRSAPSNPIPFEIHIFDGIELLYSKPLASKADRKIFEHIRQEVAALKEQ